MVKHTLNTPIWRDDRRVSVPPWLTQINEKLAEDKNMEDSNNQGESRTRFHKRPDVEDSPILLKIAELIERECTTVYHHEVYPLTRMIWDLIRDELLNKEVLEKGADIHQEWGYGMGDCFEPIEAMYVALARMMNEMEYGNESTSR